MYHIDIWHLETPANVAGETFLKWVHASINIWGFPLNESGKCVFSGSEQVRIMCLCFLRVRTVYELCQGELILDVANYDYANVFVIHPKRGEKW